MAIAIIVCILILSVVDIGKGFVLFRGSLITNAVTGGDILCRTTRVRTFCGKVFPLGTMTARMYQLGGACPGTIYLLAQLHLRNLVPRMGHVCGYTVYMKYAGDAI